MSLSADLALKYPITGIVDCCARTTKGHVATADPITPIKSRRLIAAPRGRRGTIETVKSSAAEGAVDVRFGSKADMCNAQAHVRFTPESDIKCDIWGCPLWAKSGHAKRENLQIAFTILKSTYGLASAQLLVALICCAVNLRDRGPPVA
jgi:hypothetical protein